MGPHVSNSDPGVWSHDRTLSGCPDLISTTSTRIVIREGNCYHVNASFCRIHLAVLCHHGCRHPPLVALMFSFCLTYQLFCDGAACNGAACNGAACNGAACNGAACNGAACNWDVTIACT